MWAAFFLDKKEEKKKKEKKIYLSLCFNLITFQ